MDRKPASFTSTVVALAITVAIGSWIKQQYVDQHRVAVTPRHEVQPPHGARPPHRGDGGAPSGDRARPGCRPMPASSLDPHPELAQWRCRPDGDPEIDVTNVRERYGTGEAPPEPPPTTRPPRPGDLAQLYVERDIAHNELIDAERRGDQLDAERYQAEYTRANNRLEEARRAALRR